MMFELRLRLSMTGMLACAFLSSCFTQKPIPATMSQANYGLSEAQWLSPAAIQEIQSSLPQIANSRINDIIHGQDILWYDDPSLGFAYQDSVGPISIGARYLKVGHETGLWFQRNTTGVALTTGKLLENYFLPKGFRFPFATVAGTDRVTNLKSKNFWCPPRKNTVPYRQDSWIEGWQSKKKDGFCH